MEPDKSSRPPYEVEQTVRHAERPGFRINELQISPTQRVPWHYHTNIRDTLYVLQGCICVRLREPDDQVRLSPGETYTVRERRPHLVTNGADCTRPDRTGRPARG